MGITTAGSWVKTILNTFTGTKPALPDVAPLRCLVNPAVLPPLCLPTTCLPTRQRRLLVCSLLFCLLLNGCGIGYIWHVTVGQVSLLARQQPVQDVLQDTRLNEQERQKIHLILDVKAFAVEHLGLRPSANYSTFV